MVNILGVSLPDRQLVKVGFGKDISNFADLSEPQINQLSALLSSPTTFMGSAPSTSPESSPTVREVREHGRLANLRIESDLRRQVKEDIAHHRSVGSYRGRRHAMGLPVRGQRTQTNAKTAKKMNRVERRAFSTAIATSNERIRDG
ncbi:hypothetical protein EMMF5_001814 [Cystobasidiomycetes sp. EMM_F5]